MDIESRINGRISKQVKTLPSVTMSTKRAFITLIIVFVLAQFFLVPLSVYCAKWWWNVAG